MLREVGESDNGSAMEIQENRHPELEPSEHAVKKKKRVDSLGGGKKENSQVVAGIQHHQLQ